MLVKFCKSKFICIRNQYSLKVMIMVINIFNMFFLDLLSSWILVGVVLFGMCFFQIVMMICEYKMKIMDRGNVYSSMNDIMV